MLSLKRYFQWMILGLAGGFCLFGITSSAHGQYGLRTSSSLHVAPLQPSRFVYGGVPFARSINPPVRLTTVLQSPANIPTSSTPTFQGYRTGTYTNGMGEVNSNGSGQPDANGTGGAPQPREDLQQIISQSSVLSARNAIQVLGNGSEVILRGTVVSDDDLKLAQALLLLSPQVQTVRNELTVVQ
jgi:hypothetical protein